MLLLEANIDDLELITSHAADIEVHLSAMQVDAGTPPVVQPIPLLGPAASITTATTTQILNTAGITDGHHVNVKHLNIYNNHASQSCTCTVQVNDGTNVAILQKVLLLAGESLVLTQGGVWIHYDSNGGVYPSVGNAASQTEMEAGTANDRYVTPQGVNWHPGVAKFWIKATPGGTINASWNVASEADATAGVCDITIGTDFSSAHYCFVAQAARANTNTTVTDAKNTAIRSATMAAGAISIECYDQTATNFAIEDPSYWCGVGFGDQ